MKQCKSCNNEIKGRGDQFCSFQCQQNYNREIRINEWLSGNNDGMRGKTATANWIKYYLIMEHGEKCMVCGWSERNPHTNNIPIELEHIDGDFTNNKVENLKLLCPNCHSLTSTYKGANKKGGRPRSKYYRGL